MRWRAAGDIDVRGVESGGQRRSSKLASPIYGVTIPEGYRQWEFVAPALESAPLNELRVVVGNKTALGAYRDGSLPGEDRDYVFTKYAP